MLEYLELPFVQRGLAEIGLLALAGGVIGTWIVLRGLAFFSHAIGTAALPGLVVADGLGFAAAVGAAGSAAVFSVSLAIVTPDDDERGRATATALLLVGALAAGVILASDVFGSAAALETLLFGSLLLIDGGDLALAATAAVAALLATLALGPRWLSRGFDPAGVAGPGGRLAEAALLALVAISTVAALTAVGALLVGALFVLPAAAARLLTTRMATWQLASVGLALAQGVGGTLLSLELDVPPGPTIAVIGGSGFALAAAGRTLARAGVPGGCLRLGAATLAIGVMLSALGCGPDLASSGRTRVVATTPLVADMVGEVAGSELDVVTVLEPNVDPHEYEPSPDDVEALAAADLVFASGAGLDAWLDDALDDSGSQARVVDLAAVAPIRLERAGSGELDPHWFHDPRNSLAAVDAIEAELAGLARQSRAGIERRAARYSSAIEALDRAIAGCMAAVPADERLLVTDHDAFAYLARRYRIDVIGAVIPALTTQAQPSAGELAELRLVVEREGVAAVFPEASSDGELARAIADQTDAEVGGELHADSLGAAGSPAATYLGMIGANADALVRGFTKGARGCPGAERER